MSFVQSTEPEKVDGIEYLLIGEMLIPIRARGEEKDTTVGDYDAPGMQWKIIIAMTFFDDESQRSPAGDQEAT